MESPWVTVRALAGLLSLRWVCGYIPVYIPVFCCQSRAGEACLKNAHACVGGKTEHGKKSFERISNKLGRKRCATPPPPKWGERGGGRALDLVKNIHHLRMRLLLLEENFA